MIKKNAVVTLTIGERYKELAKLTHPIIKSYADKINSDFVIIDKDHGLLHWEKYQIYHLLKDYNRIIFFDTDIIIRDDCPNLFDLVDYDEIGLFDEGIYESRYNAIVETIKAYNANITKWNGSYYNTGVMVLSRYHKELFKDPIIKNVPYVEQSFLNLRLLLDPDQWKIYDLSYKFNRMPLMDHIIGQSRLNSYVVHYAGAPDQNILIEMIKNDLQRWENDKPNYNYPKNIIINITGGLGDQTCAEPAVRYFSNQLHPNDNIYLMTDFPEIFLHLEKEVIDKKQFKGLNEPFTVLMTLPHINEHPVHNAAPATQVHLVDFSTICLCGQTIPDDDKKITILETQDGIDELEELLPNNIDFNNTILIHPGLGWESKTFPEKWWEEIVFSLSKDYTVIIIGKHIEDGNSTNRNGVLKIDYPNNVIDLTNLLSLNGLISLIKKSKYLISNDSGPIQVAGAFDNWIILIPTCKHPDNVLPYRYASKRYKTKAIYKKLTIDTENSSPINFRVNGHRLDYIKGNIIDYLPDPEEIIETINELNDDIPEIFREVL